MSLIDESGERFVRMAHLATVGSYRVNGVARMHSDLLKRTVLHDFAALWPDKFCNVTNGVTPRRFLAIANRPLASLITSRIGDQWLFDLQQLRKLESFADDQAFHTQWRDVKLAAKRDLTRYLKERTGVDVNPESLFDIQVKRIHEYKRQHLMALYILGSYLRLKREPDALVTPRTFVFAGKAAPGYFLAKLIIKLINSIAETVNSDPVVHNRLRVVFLPDYSVKCAQRVFPAGDLSEQISMAGKEASGTGNMKFALNGALTIGTLDGANPEIREEVGAENFFLFGLTVEQVQGLKLGGYRPHEVVEQNASLREILDFIGSGVLAGGDSNVFRPFLDRLLYEDPFLVLADYQAYADCQEYVSAVWRDQRAWTRKSILNTARMGKFSSDRSIREYCEHVWRVEPVKVPSRSAVAQTANARGA
jgi:starch phosphorylase